MKNNSLAAALSPASETDKIELAHALLAAISTAEGTPEARHLVAAMDRFVAEHEVGHG